MKRSAYVPQHLQARKSTLISQVSGVAASLLVFTLTFGALTIITSRALGPSDRGHIVIFMTLAGILALMATCGTHIYVRIELPKDNPAITLADYLGLTVLLVLAQAPITLVAGRLIMTNLGGSPPSIVFSLTLPIFTGLMLATYMMRDGLYALGRPGPAAWGQPIASVAQLAGVAFVWLTEQISVNVVAAILIVGQVAALLHYVRWYQRSHTPYLPRFTKAATARMVRGGLPALMSSLGQALIYRLDRIIVGLLATSAAVGIYSVAATMAELILLVPTALAQVVMYRVSAKTISPVHLSRLRATNVGVCAAVSAAAWFLAEPVVELLFGQEFAQSADDLRFLAVGMVGMAIYLVDVACINAAGRVALASWLAAGGLTLVTVLDLVLVPYHGSTGAAVASMIAYLAMGVASMVCFRVVLGPRARAKLDPDDDQTETAAAAERWPA